MSDEMMVKFVIGRNRNEKSESGIGDSDVKTVRYWLNSPGPLASWWDEFYENGNMGIGFGEVGDLRPFDSKKI